jgi:3',5'-cyclic-AMP phosphodiesterase
MMTGFRILRAKRWVTLAGAMKRWPGRKMTVLCGHTHGSGEAKILPNLNVLTGGAEYGTPVVQRILEID